ALSYGIDKEDQDQTILVYDLGGGTFDVSILDIGDGTFEVVSTAGDNRLGGDDFDQKIIDWMVAEFRKENGIDLSQDKMATQRLKDTAEKAKDDLSGVSKTQISLPFFTTEEAGMIILDLNLNRALFRDYNMSLYDTNIIIYCNILS